MDIRHIIVEGPDGSGKDGLIKRFASHFPTHRVHERASTSIGGPVADLETWLEDDMDTIDRDGPWIYNRHPLISEPIYAPIARGVEPQGLYAEPDWVAYNLAQMAEHAVMVWCLPPWNVVRHNVLSGDVAHMPGVAAHIRTLYDAYRRGGWVWPGKAFYWDYTCTPIEELVFDIRGVLNG